MQPHAIGHSLSPSYVLLHEVIYATTLFGYCATAKQQL